MKKILLLLAFGVLNFATAFAQEVKVIKMADLDKLVQKPEKGVVLLNFWSTTCRPCLQELPYFSKAQQQYADKGVEMYFISIDDAQDLDKKVKPWVKKLGLQRNVLLLNETDMDAYINLVDPQWTGVLPATLIMSGEERMLIENKITPEELNAILNKFTSNP